MEETLIEALPRPEMLTGMAWNESEFPRVSELVGCLADPASKLTMFVQAKTDFLPPIGQSGVKAEVYLTHMLGSHCVRGVHSIADLKAVGRKSFDTLTDEKISVREGLVNGVRMLGEQQYANGNLIVVAGPLFKPSTSIGTRVGSSSNNKKPNLEDIVAVPSVNCACCGAEKPTIAHDGALYCCGEHAEEGGTLVDKKAAYLLLTDEGTGVQTAFVSGLFCRRKRRHRHHVDGRIPEIGGHHWFERRHHNSKKPHDKKGVPKTYGSLSVSSDSSSSSSASSASSSSSDKRSRSGAAGASSESDEESYSSGDEVAAKMVGLSIRRLRRSKNKTPQERALDARRREVQAERDLEKERRRLAREKGRRAKAETKRSRREAEFASASGSGSMEEAALADSSVTASALPAPVNSIRELLAIRGQNPLNLDKRSLSPSLKFDSEADAAFYRVALKVAARL